MIIKEIHMNIQINQLGYTPGMKKTAVMHGKLSDTLQVLDAQGCIVLTLPVSASRTDIWGDQVAEADFSALTIPGTYTLRCGKEASWPFPISEAPYQSCLTALVDMFYYQRCGGEVDARAGVFAHPPAIPALPASMAQRTSWRWTAAGMTQATSGATSCLQPRRWQIFCLPGSGTPALLPLPI